MRYGGEYDGGIRRGYDRGVQRYDGSFRGRPAPWQRPGAAFAAPPPFPYAPFGFDPMMGPMAWPMPYGYGYAAGPRYDRAFRTPPRQSPAYGRGGDRALRAWAERYGYDVEFSIPPRPSRR